MLTQERLRELLSYDPETGIFTRLVSRPGPNGHVGAIAGCDNGQGYIRIYVDGRAYKAHRLAWFYVHGEWVKEIDHRNRNRADNHLKNLRPATRGQNRGNSGIYRNNTSGMTGVSFHAPTKKWKAQIQKDGRKKGLGYFFTAEDAHAAYLAAANAEFGEFARVA